MRVGSGYYDDQLAMSGQRLSRVSIPTMMVEGTYLKMFFRILPGSDNQSMQLHCPEFKPFRKPGIQSSIILSTGKKEEENILTAEDGMECWAKMYQITIDSLPFSEIDFNYYIHPQYQ